MKKYVLLLCVLLPLFVLSACGDGENNVWLNSMNLQEALGHNSNGLNLVMYEIGTRNYWQTSSSQYSSGSLPPTYDSSLVPYFSFEAKVEGNRLEDEENGDLRMIAPLILQICYNGGKGGWTFSDNGAGEATLGMAPTGMEPKEVVLQYVEWPGYGRVLFEGKEVDYGLYPTKRHGIVYLNSDGLTRFHPRRVITEWAWSIKFVQVTSLSDNGRFDREVSRDPQKVLPDNIGLSNMNNQPPEFYRSRRAVDIADYFLIFQRDCGGWNKMTNDTDMTSPTSSALNSAKEQKGSYGCFDNDTSYPQMEFLGRVISAGINDPRYKEAFYRAISWVLRAQHSYANGNGWPQFYPLRNGYYDNITFNDGAMIGVMGFLDKIVDREPYFAFLFNERPEMYAEIVRSRDRGLECILNTQVRLPYNPNAPLDNPNGKKSGWGQQYDYKRDCRLVTARSYEPAVLCTGENIEIARYLMNLKNWGPEVTEAIEGNVTWLREAAMIGVREIRETHPKYIKGSDRFLEDTDNVKDMTWARFYEVQDNMPIGRSNSITRTDRPAGTTPVYMCRATIRREHYNEVPLGRRTGYSWAGTWPRNIFAEYEQWKQKRPDTNYLLAGGTGMDLRDRGYVYGFTDDMKK